MRNCLNALPPSQDFLPSCELQVCVASQPPCWEQWQHIHSSGGLLTSESMHITLPDSVHLCAYREPLKCPESTSHREVLTELKQNQDDDNIIFCFCKEVIPRWCSGPCRRSKRCGFDPWVGKIPWRRKLQPTLVFLPGNVHGQRSLAAYSPWGHKGCEVVRLEIPSSYTGKDDELAARSVWTTGSLGLEGWHEPGPLLSPRFSASQSPI